MQAIAATNQAIEPRISVVIPLYNKAAYVLEAVRSALAQSPSAFEVLVIDDGSTDNGLRRLDSIQDERLRCIRKENGGVSSARNMGIELASGEYIAFLDADDLYLPGYFDQICKLILKFPSASIWATGYVCAWPDGRRQERVLLMAGEVGGIEYFYGKWTRTSFMCTDSIVVAKYRLEKLASLFPVGEALGEDQDLWFRLAEAGTVAYSATALVEYRMDVPSSATNSKLPTQPLPCYVRLAERLGSRAVPAGMRAGAKRLLSSHLINVARAASMAGQHTKAIALLADPRSRANIVYWFRSWVFVWFDRLIK